MQPLELFVGIGHYSIPLIFGNVVPGSEVKNVVFAKGFGLQDAIADGFAHKVPIDNRRLLGRVNLGAQDTIFFSGGEVAIDKNLAQKGDVVELVDADQPVDIGRVIHGQKGHGREVCL